MTTWQIIEFFCKSGNNCSVWPPQQEISDISTVQARALEAQQVSRDKEVLSLRQQLLDFQSQSDEKTVIGWCFSCLILFLKAQYFSVYLLKP